MKAVIPFNKPLYLGKESELMAEAIQFGKLCGDGPYSKKCQQWFEQRFDCKKTLLVSSCTHALELAALLLDIQPGDEVIMPSFTFVSTANPFVLRGASIVFVDVRPDTMNMDETLIEDAITAKTKAIVPVHYAGVSCDMDVIMALAEKYGLFVVEDAAQGVMSSFRGKALGTIGHLAAYSFHETKNYTSGGEGGLLLINDERFAHRAEVLREKGTNRSQFFRGMVDKYTWVDIGSSYLPSELQAAYLFAQLDQADSVNNKRLAIWSTYHDAFQSLEKSGEMTLPRIANHCQHNAHMYYLRLQNLEQRTAFIKHMANAGIQTAFHYIPLHLSPAGTQFGRFEGQDRYTSSESDKLVRLPLFYGMTNEEVQAVVRAVLEFFV